LVAVTNGGDGSLSDAFEPPEHRRRRLDVLEEMIELTARQIGHLEQGELD
jgi:hypothetical protein